MKGVAKPTRFERWMKRCRYDKRTTPDQAAWMRVAFYAGRRSGKRAKRKNEAVIKTEVKMLSVPYWRDKEWSMGNGQCPECCGVPESWFGQPLHLNPESIGHNKDCPLAEVLFALGEAPVMQGSFKSDKKFEWCMNDAGIIGIREATPEGCPRYKEWMKQSFSLSEAGAKIYAEAFESLQGSQEVE